MEVYTARVALDCPQAGKERAPKSKDTQVDWGMLLKLRGQGRT